MEPLLNAAIYLPLGLFTLDVINRIHFLELNFTLF